MTSTLVTVGEIMKREVITVTRDLDVRSLISLLSSKKISGVAVVDEDNKLIGVVSKTDIVDRLNMENLLTRERQSLDFDPFAGGVIVFREIGADFFDQRVEDFMTKNVITARQNSPLSEISDKMLQNRIHRIIIVNDDNEVIGQVSVMDLVTLLK